MKFNIGRKRKSLLSILLLIHAAMSSSGAVIIEKKIMQTSSVFNMAVDVVGFIEFVSFVLMMTLNR